MLHNIMTDLKFNIRRAEVNDLDALIAISEANRSRKDRDYWNLCAARLEAKELIALLAEAKEGQAVGYGFLNWHPKYRLYERLGIPEIQDLNVLEEFRRQGIARALIRMCEEAAIEKGHEDIGISFGLTKEFGSAQQLYIALGYVPDGYGVTYDREPVQSGQFRSIDDNLCLMLVKKLSAKSHA